VILIRETTIGSNDRNVANVGNDRNVVIVETEDAIDEIRANNTTAANAAGNRPIRPTCQSPGNAKRSRAGRRPPKGPKGRRRRTPLHPNSDRGGGDPVSKNPAISHQIALT